MTAASQLVVNDIIMYVVAISPFYTNTPSRAFDEPLDGALSLTKLQSYLPRKIIVEDIWPFILVTWI